MVPNMVATVPQAVRCNSNEDMVRKLEREQLRVAVERVDCSERVQHLKDMSNESGT